MRVAPVGLAFDNMEEVLAEAERSARVTHDHPEGIRGAKSVAAAVFLARQRPDKSEIANYIKSEFGYRLDQPLKSVRRTFVFDVSCEGTVPWAIQAFLEANSYEDTVRNAVSFGGDADTLACIAGAVAGAYYGVPTEIAAEVMTRLDHRLLGIVRRFTEKFDGQTR
jgi:ADP-ribosylglycohydrolase